MCMRVCAQEKEKKGLGAGVYLVFALARMHGMRNKENKETKGSERESHQSNGGCGIEKK